MPRLAGFTHGLMEPAGRFRFIQYRPWLERLGWEVVHYPCRPPRPWRSPLSSRPLRALHQWYGRRMRAWNRRRDIDAARNADVVFLNRDLLQGDPAWEARLWKRNPRIVFDFDDALHEMSGGRQAEWMCRHAAWVTVGNETLAEWARRFTERVTVIPTVVDVRTYETAGHAPDRIRLGWCGSDHSIYTTLVPFLPMFSRLQEQFGYEFVVMSRPKPRLPDTGLQWTFVEWSESNERQLGRHMDIGIMPLSDTPFHRGKCGIKLIQYMACGLPFVASPIGINDHLCGEGRRGFPAVSEADWAEAIDRLMRQEQLRREMGRNGRAFTEEQYDIERWAGVLSDLFTRVAQGTRQ